MAGAFGDGRRPHPDRITSACHGWPSTDREAAWVLMEERLRDAAAFAIRCGELCTPALMEPLAKVARSREKYADQLLAAK